MAGRLEQRMQTEFVRMVRLLSPGTFIFAIPNGGARSEIEGKILKGMGVVAGVADLCVILDGGRVGWLEAKEPPDIISKKSRGKLSTAQEAFRDHVQGRGHLWAEFRTVDEGLKTLRAWGVPLCNFYM